MSAILVRRLHTRQELEEPLSKELRDLENEIRETAQRLSDSRSAEDDWVRAERQVCWAPQAELKESDRGFRLVMGIPGLNPEEVEVTLLPEMVIVRGVGARESDRDERIHFSEFGSGTLFRQVQLPSLVHVDSAVVAFDRHLLKVSAAKLELDA